MTVVSPNPTVAPSEPAAVRAPTSGRNRRGRPARRLLGACVIGAIACLAAGPPAAPIAIGAAVGVPVAMARRRRRNARRGIDGDIATVLEMAARQVRAGTAVGEALALAARSTPGAGSHLVLGMMQAPAGAARARELVAGTVGHAVHGDSVVAGAATMKIVAAVVGMVQGAEGGGARGLEAGASLLREHERARGEIDAGASHARASASLLVAVPLVFALAAVVVLPSSAGGALGDPKLFVPVVTGIAMEALGALWSARLVRAALGVAG